LTMEDEHPSVSLLRKYLQIKSVHPFPDYKGTTEFLLRLADEIGLDHSVFELISGKPIVLITWKGEQSQLPSILLNSHTDVVPVSLLHWHHDPFAAIKDEEGNIFARGIQDMKSVSLQYLEAVRKLKASGIRLKRSVHMLFVPDEEIGGTDGLGKFVENAEFEKLNVGVALDEGLASPEASMVVFYGERAPWWVKVKAIGPTGHGSRFIQNTAMEKLIRVVNRLLHFRSEQFEELQRSTSQCGKKLGDVTTVNLTMLKGGVTGDGGITYSVNVIPTEAEAAFDIRIPPTVNLDDFMKQLNAWILSEEGVTYEFLQYTLQNSSTDISDDNKWWKVFRSSLESMNLTIDTQIFPAATDSRFLRNRNIPAFGFSPMNYTPTLLHDHNEFLNEKIFLKGIEIYMQLITDLGNFLA